MKISQYLSIALLINAFTCSQLFSELSQGLEMQQLNNSGSLNKVDSTQRNQGSTLMPKDSGMSVDFASVPDVASGQVESTGDMSLTFSENIENEGNDEDLFLSDQDPISVDFPGEEARTILRNLASLYDLNLVIPDTLVGTSSIKLKNVTWRQVFDVILKPLGYTFTEEGNIIQVVSIEQINLEPMTIRTFPIKYAKAGEVAESLSPIVATQGGGSIQVDKRSNTLIVKDRPTVLLEIENLLNTSTLDRPSMQVMIETKFIELSLDQGTDPNAPEGLGFDWWGIAGNGAGPFARAQEFGKIDGQLDFFNNIGGTFFKSAILSADIYKLALNALETTNNASLVANPTVVVLNNEEARFHVGRNQPIIEANFDETTGQVTVGEVEYRPIGIEVNVTPRINEGAEQISLEIQPRVSRIVGEVVFQGVISYPIESIRETTTRVSIKNGYTLALGGLIQDDDVDKVERVPILSCLPGPLGRIFQNKKKQREKINLIMFITAKALNPDGSTYLDVIDPRLIANMGISDYDIPGYANGVEVPGITKMTEGQRQLLQHYKDLNHDDSVCSNSTRIASNAREVEDCFCNGNKTTKHKQRFARKKAIKKFRY